MGKRLLWIGIVALIVVLGGLNFAQWYLRTERLRVQDLPPAPAPPEAEEEASSPARVPRGAVRSLILFVGDGMGVVHVTAASLRRHGAAGRLSMERMPVTGLLRTESAAALVTDSAASATAMSTGVSVRNGRVAMDGEGRRLEHLLARAAATGRSTGVVTTDEVTAATPASFAAHAERRGRHGMLARGMLDSSLDLLVGGGGSRFDGELRSVAGERGFAVVEDVEGLREAGPGRVLGLLASGLLGVGEGEPRLAELVEVALARLGGDPEGFVLVVEEARIDKRSHHWEAEASTDRVLELDDAVAVARRFARGREDVLVVVTADHECGGLALTTRQATPMEPVAGFRTHGHTASPVALFAEGAGAGSLTGLMHVTVFGRRLAELLGVSAGSSAGGQR